MTLHAVSPQPLRRAFAGLAVVLLTGLSAPAATAAPAASTQPTLSSGARGAAVLTLQKRLAALRYDVGAADGVFGADTFHAVVAFQKVNGLSRTGVVAASTWARLAKPVVPQLRHAYRANFVEVDLTHQVLLLARGSSVLRIYDVSTGRPSTPTRLGAFRVYRRVNGWHNAGLGTVYRPNYFSGGYSIHAYSPVPAYPASHGCVRMTYTEMARAWGSMYVGMPVWIYR